METFAGPMNSLSYLRVPSPEMLTLRVRHSPARGLLFELKPRWETPTWDGTYGLGVQQVLQEGLKPGSVFYDLCNNIVFSTSGYVALGPADSARRQGNAHVFPNTDHYDWATKIPCTSLSDLGLKFVVPNTIKIDEERAESNVMNGGEKLFTHSRPHFICAVHDPVNASLVETLLIPPGSELRLEDNKDSFPRQLMAAPK
jgi:FkbM family methyltransferase